MDSRFSDIKVRIEQPVTVEEAIYIYIYRPTRTGIEQYFPGSEGPLVKMIEEGSVLSPSLKLSPSILKALVTEGSKITPPDKAMQNHLEDAVKVRDRLLTIIESEYRIDPK